MKETGNFFGVRTTLKFRRPMGITVSNKNVEVDFPNPERHHVFPNYPVNFERLCFLRYLFLSYIFLCKVQIFTLFLERFGVLVLQQFTSQL